MRAMTATNLTGLALISGDLLAFAVSSFRPGALKTIGDVLALKVEPDLGATPTVGCPRSLGLLLRRGTASTAADHAMPEIAGILRSLDGEVNLQIPGRCAEASAHGGERFVGTCAQPTGFTVGHALNVCNILAYESCARARGALQLRFTA